MARGRHPVSEILERSGEGEEGVGGRLLLLEGRTAAAAGRATVGRDGGNPNGVGRARVRVLHDSFGHGSESEHANGRCLLADPEDMSILDGDDRKRAKLIAERLRHWKSIKTA